MKEGCRSFISHGNQATSGYDPKIRSWPPRQWPTKAERRGRTTSQKEKERHETLQCCRRGGRGQIQGAFSNKQEKPGSAIRNTCSVNSSTYSLPWSFTQYTHVAYLVMLRSLCDFCPQRCGALVAIAEFILDLLKVVVTVNGRKNIVGFFSIHVKSMMLRKK